MSRVVPDLEWDAFVEATAGGTYHQSSIWAQVKAVVGWNSARLVLRREGTIVAGCQLLLRTVPFVGTIAYVPRGPVVADRDAHTLSAMLTAVQGLADQERIVYLKLQPPPGGCDMIAELTARGFVESELEAAPRATVRIDLQRCPDALFSRMRQNARRNIRKAERLGVVVREGGEQDLGEFYRLIDATSRRQGFSSYPQKYYEQLWRAFAARDRARLLIVEHNSVVLASNLVVGFADTAVFKIGGWSGARKDVPPNELLHWAGIQWGKACGYRYYDFDNINLSVAQAVLSGAQPPVHAYHGVARFKLGFGGEVVIFPSAYDYTCRPLLAGALRRLAPKLERLRPLANWALGRASTSTAGSPCAPIDHPDHPD
jgi:lipid II:glycine glycyltransferase (peptidoglycan interpeptide bridge formation enzyme)